MTESDDSKKIEKQKPSNERDLKTSFVFWLLGFAVLIALDQYAKHLAFHSTWGGALNKLWPVAAKQLFLNNQFAFSLPLPVWLMYALYAIVLLVTLRYFLARFKKLPLVSLLAFALIFAGAASNIGERIINGSVRDFIYFFTGIFNLADVYIVIGILILLFQSNARAKE